MTMNRTRALLAVFAAATLALAGCSSATDGAAAAESSGTTSTESAATDADTDDAADAGTEEPADEQSSDDAAPSTVVASGDMDAQSAAWFNQFCEIGEPMNDFLGSMMGAAMMGMSGEEVPEAQLVEARDGLATAFHNLGAAMTDLGAKMANLPAPAVENGEQIAQNVTAGLAQGGPYMQTAAEQIAAADTSSVEAFGADIEATMDSMDDMQSALGVDEIDIDDELKAAVAQLPNCAGTLLFDDTFTG